MEGFSLRFKTTHSLAEGHRAGAKEEAFEGNARASPNLLNATNT